MLPTCDVTLIYMFQVPLHKAVSSETNATGQLKMGYVTCNTGMIWFSNSNEQENSITSNVMTVILCSSQQNASDKHYTEKHSDDNNDRDAYLQQ